MRAPVSWIRELVALPADVTGRQIAERITAAGLEVESVETVGGPVAGELVLGTVLEIEELTEFRKPIRWCQVDCGEAQGSRGIICGARNFAVGDLVVVALPGTTLPGDFTITARETYGHVSDGMICSERELGLSEEHAGIIVLPADSGSPGEAAREVLGLGEEILEIAVTPDRGYALSIRGIAREVATAFDVPFEDPADELSRLPAPAPDVAPQASGSDDLEACPLFTMRTIVDFDPTRPSPGWMRRRLTACGMRPVSLAVDVTNYVMLELGQPLHAFDRSKLRGTVRAARASAGQSVMTLDHVTRSLTEEDLCIVDDRGPLGLAGLMGGAETEIDDLTTQIALEAAYFDARTIASASRRHRLNSEAGRRFERGVDRMLAPNASARAAALLLEFGGGRYAGMTGVEAPFHRTVIDFDLHEPGAVAGMEISEDTVVSKLVAVGCVIEPGEQPAGVSSVRHASIQVPSWRPDLVDPADLDEEVLRLVGYGSIGTRLPVGPVGRGRTGTQRLVRRIGMALAARGLEEVLTYPFVGAAQGQWLRLPPDHEDEASTRLANPIDESEPYLRASMLAGLLAAAVRNAGRGHGDVAIFEMGSVFRGMGSGSPVRPAVDRRPTEVEWQALNAQIPEQHRRLGILLCGLESPAGWGAPARAHSWSDAISLAVYVGHVAGVRLNVSVGAHPSFHPGRCALILLPDGTPVGFAGELHPGVSEATGLAPRCCAVELDLDALLEAAPERSLAPTIGTHPVAKEDLAVVAGIDVAVADVEGALRRGAGSLLEDIRLFDVYTGPQVPQGCRSLAFTLRFRAPDRTLTADEIAAARGAALAEAERACGAVLRLA